MPLARPATPALKVVLCARKNKKIVETRLHSTISIILFYEKPYFVQ